MGKMGPEIERLKKKYGDDKDELNKAMMQVYKQQGFTPVLGCLPMFLQMPIWIALYAALNSTFELRQEPFLWGWTWIKDLARPDHLITWAPIKLFWGIEIGALNILPILLAVVFFLQQKYTPKPPATTPEQQQQQKMMQWMSLLFPVFLYNGPSGLNLYILTSTTIGIRSVVRTTSGAEMPSTARCQRTPRAAIHGTSITRVRPPRGSVASRAIESPKVASATSSVSSRAGSAGSRGSSASTVPAAIGRTTRTVSRRSWPSVMRESPARGRTPRPR